MSNYPPVSFISIFETKSNRVKGVAFHPTRPWLLASLHNGVIQLWDYRIRTLVDRFGEHDGPVRSVDFHLSQPLFVSGGDDYKIKVWNYKERRCLFTFHRHVDYVRTVQFHHENPWILSSSDDQTIRIWNWQSRSCIAVLTGHSHYVMCARFHPKDDLVVSCSLDQTVRVWDISGLGKKKERATTQFAPDDPAARIQEDLFGNTDAVVKFVLEGHDRGVNWCEFHPSMPLVVSGADDRQIKLWRIGESKAWEVDTMRGHYNNVSSVVFHKKEDLMLTNSEDRTIQVWDLNKRQSIYTHKREHERFWVMSVHPKENIFVAGHDSGLIVFKLARERPPHTSFKQAVQGDTLYYLKDRSQLRSYSFETGADSMVIGVPRKGKDLPRSLYCNSRGDTILIFGNNLYAGYYTIVPVGKGDAPGGSTFHSGVALGVVWTKRNRFAALQKSGLINIIDPATNAQKKCITPPHSADAIFPGPPDSLLIRSDDIITLYDIQQERTIAEAKIPNVKNVRWCSSGKTPMLALLCRGAVVLTSHRLERLCTVPETLRVKSGVWDENGTFIYNTLCHIKYLLPNGDHGIVRTLDRAIYITAVKGTQLFCMDRTTKNRRLIIDSTEFTFKRALADKQFDEVLRMVKNYNLIGQAIIGYLQKQGYPELALQFVKDERSRFNLALECSSAHNIDIALAAAKVLNDSGTWSKLAKAALNQGNLAVVETAFQQNNDFERLSFLYTVTGNVKNLKKMLHIAQEKRKNPSAVFQNSLLVGNVEARVKMLLEVGQVQLAYMTAITHGLTEIADNIRNKLQGQSDRENEARGLEAVPIPFPSPSPTAKFLCPPTPFLTLDHTNWPLTRIPRGVFDPIVRSATSAVAASGTTQVSARLAGVAYDDNDGAGEDTEVGAGGWGDDDLSLEDSDADGPKDGDYHSTAEDDDELNLGDGWGGDDDIGLDEVEEEVESGLSSAADTITLPPAGTSRPDVWARISNQAADLVAAGRFDAAMAMLNRQVGAVNFSPLKEHFVRIANSNCVQFIANGSLPPLPSYLERNWTSAGPVEGLPRHLSLSLQSLINDLKTAYKHFTNGKFNDAKAFFETILHSLLLIVPASQDEKKEMAAFVQICMSYLLGLNLELKRKEAVSAKSSPALILELAAYFTHCNLQPNHMQLSLNLAMNTAAKLKNYLTADEFGRRLLDLSPPANLKARTQKVLKLCEQKGRTDAHTLNYDSRNPFVLCASTFTPIYQGSPSVTCPYCKAHYLPDQKSKLCSICNICEIGKEVVSDGSGNSRGRGTFR